MYKKLQSKPRHVQKGFTLLEVLLVVAALGILAATVILAINPGKQLSQTRDAQRWSDVNTILNATYQYAIDHSGSLPSGMTSELKVLGTASSGCNMSCGALAGETNTFVDNTQAEFNLGSHNETQYDVVNGWLELTPTGQNNGSGIFSSSIKDTGILNAAWSSLEWVSTWPFYKELPNNGSIESQYQNGNVSMVDNQALLHFNETIGATGFSDSSGTSHTGVCASGCPTAGIGGELNTAVEFDGVDDRIRIGTITPIDDFTISVWVRPDVTTCPGSNDCEILQSSSGLVFDFNDSSEYRICSIWPACVSVPLSTIDVGVWQQLAAVRSGGICTLYKNGSPVPGGSGACSTDPQEGIFYIGGHSANDRFFDGGMDEFAYWNRALSAEELIGIYRRGVLKLKYQVRSCDDPSCDTEIFVGPDGTSGTYFSELNSTSVLPPSFSLSNVSDNQYFQYRTYLETDDATYSPEINSITVEYSLGGIAGEVTADACLDIGGNLVSGYLTSMPTDPKDGSAANTYYAIKRTASNRVEVKACSNEEEIISVSR
ncbi:MAG: LamG-like jellyroll fold domain-containing protein [bacterium]